MADLRNLIQADDLTLSVTASDSDRPPDVLLLHGLGSDSAATWGASGWFGTLRRAGWTWVAPDLPGHGQSDKPHVPARYRPDRLVADVLAVLDASDVSRVDVVAYSMGSRIAMHLASAAPERIGRVVLGGFSAGPHERPALDGALSHLPAGIDGEAIRACVTGLLGGPAVDPSAVRAPVLLVAGSDDPFAAMVEPFAAGFPDARVRRIGGRNHVTTPSAREFKAEVVDFLRDKADAGG